VNDGYLRFFKGGSGVANSSSGVASEYSATSETDFASNEE
jgi:hypothetical protein